ncbi:hypothetical protein K438DRAFT_1767025 [Mycena galopus ATCC 62051]|nr:hypothetical protein K438DRAFT_1784994 [Mycena galopus ATCC 62051]KAF8183361.1 hypothetical protein K438DRAFT_1767025 [Mycena galopus ATCC 62051]
MARGTGADSVWWIPGSGGRHRNSKNIFSLGRGGGGGGGAGDSIAQKFSSFEGKNIWDSKDTAISESIKANDRNEQLPGRDSETAETMMECVMEGENSRVTEKKSEMGFKRQGCSVQHTCHSQEKQEVPRGRQRVAIHWEKLTIKALKCSEEVGPLRDATSDTPRAALTTL